MRKASIFSAAFAGLMLASAAYAPANATFVQFTFKDGAATVASGDFTYSSAATNIGYADLTDFHLSAGTGNFNFSFLGLADQNLYFNFNTVTQQFVNGTSSGGCFGSFGAVLSATQGCFVTGYYFKQIGADGNHSEFSIFPNDPPDVLYTDIQFVVSDGGNGQESVPEPATLALLGAGLLSAGFFGRRRAKDKASA